MPKRLSDSKYETALEIICQLHGKTQYSAEMTVFTGKRNISLLTCGTSIKKRIPRPPKPSAKNKPSTLSEILLPNEWKVAFLMEGEQGVHPKQYFICVGELIWDQQDKPKYQFTKFNHQAVKIGQSPIMENPSSALRYMNNWRRMDGHMVMGLMYHAAQVKILNQIQ